MLSLRRAWLGAMIPLIVVAIAAACGDDPAPNSATPDGGAQPVDPGNSVCPATAPDAGEGCVVPEGTTCAFDAGGCYSPIAQCSRGTWRFAGNPPPSPEAAVCPVDFPASESDCACFPASIACTYGTCDGADATASVSRASCDAGRWSVVTVETCERPDGGEGDAGPQDAGADVQGDADADVD